MNSVASPLADRPAWNAGVGRLVGAAAFAALLLLLWVGATSAGAASRLPGSDAATRLPAPGAVAVVPKVGAVLIRWRLPAGARRGVVVGFELQARRDGSVALARRVSRTARSVTLSPLIAAAAYDVRVRALTRGRASAWSAPRRTAAIARGFAPGVLAVPPPLPDPIVIAPPGTDALDAPVDEALPPRRDDGPERIEDPDQTVPPIDEPEPSTPEPSTPEPSTPEPSSPEPSSPEPSTPEPSTPEPSTPEPSTPEPSTPEPSTPEPSTPEPSTPQPSTPAEPQPTTPAADPQPSLTLPVVRITTTAGAPIASKETYVGGAMAVTAAAGGDPSMAWSGALEIKGRGNSTWEQPKKPYRVKLAKAAALLGMPKSKHWVLLANAFDPSHLRNATAFDLGRRTVLGWTPRSRYVELVLNDRYVGLYQLTEHVRIDPARIAIDALAPGDIAGDAVTGGYHLERDGRWNPNEEPGFVSNGGEVFALKDPEAPAPEQLAYIQGYVNDTEAALGGADFADPATGYAAWIDVDSFVDWYVVMEWTLNYDAWQLSTNLVKPRGGKLAMGPPWDFDLSMGRRWEPGEMSPVGDWVTGKSPWFARLVQDPAFMAKVRSRWPVVRGAIADRVAAIQAQAAQLGAAAALDRQVWGGGEGAAGEANKVAVFLEQRAAWLDERWAD